MKEPSDEPKPCPACGCGDFLEVRSADDEAQLSAEAKQYLKEAEAWAERGAPATGQRRLDTLWQCLTPEDRAAVNRRAQSK